MKGYTGQYSVYPESDKGGEQMLQLMKECDLAAVRTMRQPTRSHWGSATYVPKSKEWAMAQQDYILVSRR